MEKILDAVIKSELATKRPADLGISPSYFSLLQSGKRQISATIADLLGYDVVVSFVKRAPASEIYDQPHTD